MNRPFIRLLWSQNRCECDLWTCIRRYTTLFGFHLAHVWACYWGEQTRRSRFPLSHGLVTYGAKEWPTYTGQCATLNCPLSAQTLISICMLSAWKQDKLYLLILVSSVRYGYDFTYSETVIQLIYISIFSLLFFVKKSRHSVFMFVPEYLSAIIFYQLTYFHETWCEFCSTGGHSTFILAKPHWSI